MPQLRTSPSGPPIVGSLSGDFLQWNGTEWLPVSAASLFAFDFVIVDRASLVAAVGAPVGGIFDLPTGSYAFAESVVLNTGERIRVQNANVFIQGFGVSKQLTSTGLGTSPIVEIGTGASVQLLNLTVVATETGTAALNAAGADSDCQLTMCRLVGGGGGAGGNALNASGAAVKAVQCSFEAADSTAVNHTGAQLQLVQCTLTTTTGNALSLGGVSAFESYLTQCSLVSNGGSNVVHGANAANLYLADCSCIQGNAATDVVSVADANNMTITGGLIRNTDAPSAAGVSVDGNANGIVLSGVQFENVSECLIRSAGTQDRVTMIGCDSASTVGNGINWTAANLPTNGLLVQGCQFDTATPFLNFTAASPRANIKGVSQQGALSSETAIVP